MKAIAPKTDHRNNKHAIIPDLFKSNGTSLD